MRFQDVDETVTFLHGPFPILLPPPPPPPPPPHRGPLHNLTVLLLDLEKKFEICMLWPLGALCLGGRKYYMNNFESPAPKDDSCQVWLKSDHAFSRRRWNSYFLQRGAPSPTFYLPQGPIGATLGTAMNKFYSSPNKDYVTWLFSFWIWRRRCLKFAWFWPLGALCLGPIRATHTIWTTLNPLPLRMIPAKFG